MTRPPIGRIATRIVSRFPFEKTVDRLPNDPRMDWLFSVVEGLPDARKKRLILQARSPEVGFLDDGQTDVMLDALGIRGA